jgi:mannose/fructose-specific phosphotransferase system component IIA
MIGVVVVTHGQLATELVNAAETIVGDLPNFSRSRSAGTKTSRTRATRSPPRSKR